MKKRFDVITIGSALRDVMFYSDAFSVRRNSVADPTKTRLLCAEYGAKIRSEEVYFEFGGGAANTAVNFSGLELRTGMLTAVGNDLDGVAITKHVKEKGVNVSLVQTTDAHRTGFSFLAVDSHSGEHVAYVYYGAVQDLVVNSKLLQSQPSHWYYITSLNTERWKKILQQLYTQKETAIAWNPGEKQLQAGYKALASFIRRTDILILNKDEATGLVLSHPKVTRAGTIQQMLKQIHSWGAQIVVITNGRKGAFAYDGTQFYEHDAPQDTPKDTTGAGDCFGSSFVAGYIHYDKNIEKSMDLAILNATTLVRTIGAQQGLLRWKDLPRSLRKAAL